MGGIEPNVRSDGDLLAAFAHQGDKGAFEEIVRRHGTMVLRVCRRVVRCEHDAEDAAQAVFLTLAFKASNRSLQNRLTLSSWLHLVAWHTAKRLWRAGKRREVREHKALLQEPATPGVELNPRELLDGELKNLPEKYRLPIILFHLEGRSLEEISTILHSKPSTVGMRLSRGRDLLRERINRRGVILSSSVLFAILTAEMASAFASPLFASSTAQAAVLLLQQNSAFAGWASPIVQDLVSTTVKTLFFEKVKWVGLALAASATLAVLPIALWKALPQPEEETIVTDLSLQPTPPLVLSEAHPGPLTAESPIGSDTPAPLSPPESPEKPSPSLVQSSDNEPFRSASISLKVKAMDKQDRESRPVEPKSLAAGPAKIWVEKTGIRSSCVRVFLPKDSARLPNNIQEAINKWSLEKPWYLVRVEAPGEEGSSWRLGVFRSGKPVQLEVTVGLDGQAQVKEIAPSVIQPAPPKD